ncbi:hypothetical protein [Helicobacter sp.]|uniref:hypothetical protein n=1 Tax=Helicobacter sp. TaxID=218 RepID=UPI0025B8EA2B|nr:hypothetical protein [Helicobacter sp.]MCI5968957.1 hypothetical protein [Helicobacter sp.]MDY2584297.1 hypothetical protein [Helicobacter sp.]
MQNLSDLRELTQKLDEIKEVWQIYAIFEEARKKFNDEFNTLKKDKEALVESFNDISAKNAFLLAQNKELEAKNKALKESNLTLEKSDSNFLENLESNPLESQDFSNLATHYASLQEILKTMQEIFAKLPHIAPEPVTKLEVSYQKHQRLLANPAKDYVEFKKAKELFDTLINVESKFKTLDLEFSKLQIEMHDLLQTPKETLLDSTNANKF